jgi:hypothetical protein
MAGPAIDSFDAPYYGRDAQLVPIARSDREHRPTFPVEQSSAELGGATILEVLHDGSAATTALEVDRLALVASCSLTAVDWFTPFVDDAGEPVASLHSQFVAWRRRPGGRVTTESPAAARLVKTRAPIPISG